MRSLISALLLVAALASGCRGGDDDVIAEVYGQKLLRSEIEGMVASEVSGTDSAAIIERYIDQWLDHAILLQKAEKNIKEDFTPQLERYRNSLLIYAYEQKIIGQLIDTAISDPEVQNYYGEHRDDFVLKRPMMRVMYVKMRLDAPNLRKMTTLMGMAQISEEALMDIQRIAAQEASEYDFDDEKWQTLDQLRFKLPDNLITHPEQLHNRRITQLTDSSGVSLLHITDLRMSDDYAPVESVRESIRIIILNRRKEEIVNTLRHDLRRQAEADGAISIYKSGINH